MGSARAWCLFLVLTISLLSSSNACSMPDGWRPPTTVETITRAEVVLYGRILRTYPDSKYNYGSGSKVYSAEMEVYCSLKGQQVNKITNITEAGYIAGHCTETKLEVGNDYVVPLNGDFRPHGMSQINITELSNVTQACNLNPVYPINVDARTALVKCPVPTPSDNCPVKKPSEDDSSAEVHHTGAYAIHFGESRDETQNGASGQHSLTSRLTLVTAISLAMTSLHKSLTRMSVV